MDVSSKKELWAKRKNLFVMYTTISNCTQITSNSRDYKELEDLLFQPFYASTEENRRNKVWKQHWKK